MRLYHSAITITILGLFAFLATACAAPQAAAPSIHVSVIADGHNLSVQLPTGSTVRQALQAAGLTLGELDEIQPSEYTLLNEGDTVKVVRVREEFQVELETIPFEQLRQPTEFLPEGQLKLDPIQKGEPGTRQVTYRLRYEDGKMVARTLYKSEVIKQPVPQVVLVGVQPLILHLQIPGRLAYLFNGEAWIMDARTDNRRAVITSGDLDGRVFSLSPDGEWLLFTRRSADKDQINELWVAHLSTDPVQEIDLGVKNVVHFADWLPASNSRVAFSTVEPRVAAPGWQANNDLYALTFSPSGWVTKWKDKPVLEANSGGIYGWWGMNFVWSPDGKQLAYARADSIGLLDYEQGTLTTTLPIVPLQTGGDWAWVPGITWSPDGRLLFSVTHSSQVESGSAEQSQVFDLVAVEPDTGLVVRLAPQTGMFAYPLASPLQIGLPDEQSYQVAYLQASFPNQSETSRYRLVVMDRDGSNRSVLFPPEDRPGLQPQQVVWSPAPLPELNHFAIALIYEGNLWLVDAQSGQAHQVTGEGLISRLSWR